MPAERRLWDSCTIIDYLKGVDRAKPCIEIINHMRAGTWEIVISVIAEGEVAHLGNVISHETAEKMIQEFFGRPYVIRAGYDRLIAADVRRLIRSYPGLTSLDAAHVATALRWHVPLLETYDDRLLALDGKEGNPPLTIQIPKWNEPSSGPLFEAAGMI